MHVATGATWLWFCFGVTRHNEAVIREPNSLMKTAKSTNVSNVTNP